MPLRRAQTQALGILTQAAGAAEQAGARGLPATVSIPNGQQQVIAAPLPGLILSLDTAPGLSVRKGQLLARIASPQALELQKNKLQADAQATLARQALQRDEQLFREGLIAESRLQNSRANATQAQALASEQRALLSLAQYSGGQTLSLLAPIDGVVLEQSASVGQRVEQAAPIYRIARLTPLAVDIQAPLSVASQARPGTALSVPGTAARGELVAVGRAVDPASQSVLLRGLIKHGADALRPGQATTVDLELDSSAGGARVMLPASALFHQGDKTWVFVQTREGQNLGYRAQSVQLLGKTGEGVLVSGVALGTPVVSTGVAALKAIWLGVGKE